MEDLFENTEITSTILGYGTNIIGAIAIFIIGRMVARLLKKLLNKAMEKSKVDESLSGFLSNLAYAAMLVFVIISALGTLGVDTTSFAAVIAAAGLAIGLALQGSLGNLASGVMLVVFKPFVKGNFVEVAGTAGTVQEITIFNTVLKTADNKVIIVPNDSITSGTITNYSKEKTRRVDFIFGISYDDDIKLAKNTLEKILKKDERILKDPEPVIAVSELADSSVNIACRPWVKTADYWGVYFDTLETVKIEFDKAGLSIPFPQQDVHLHEAQKAPTKKKKK